jgi:hypothetical protein
MNDYEVGFFAGQDFVLRYIIVMWEMGEIGDGAIKRVMDDFGYKLVDGKYVNEG